MSPIFKESQRSYDVRISDKTTVHYELSDAGQILRRTAFDSEGRITSLLYKTDSGNYQEQIFSPEEE